MNWQAPEPGQMVTCESVAAVVLHARYVSKVTPVKLGGHTAPRPITLCGTEAAWDTMSPLSAVHCRSCLAELAKPRGGS